MKHWLAAAAILGSAIVPASAQELTYWSVWAEPEPQAQVLRQLFDDYEAAHPGVTIRSVWIGRQNLVQLRSHLAAGNTIDLMDGDARIYLGLAMQEDFAVDLADLASEIEGDVLPHTVPLLAEDGVQHGIPYIHNAVVFLYSKQAFEEAGVGDPPQTLDELFAVCTQLQDAGLDPIALEGNLGYLTFYYATYLLDQIAGPDYIRTIVEDRTGEGWRSQEVQRMLELSRAFWDDGCIPPESAAYQWPTAQQNLAVGITAMELVGSWVPTELAQAVEPDFRWGAFPFPSVEGGQNAGSLNTAMMAMGVHTSSPNQEVATDVLRFIMSDEAQQTMATEAAVGVVNRHAEWIPALAEVKQIVEAAPGAVVEDNVSAYYPDYGANILLPTYGRFFREEIDVEAFMETMATQTREYWAGR